MHPLDEHSRRHLLALAAALCAIPVALAPLAARSSRDAAGRSTHVLHRVSPLPPLQWRSPRVRAVRDPFAGDPDSAVPEKPVLRSAASGVAFVEAIATGAQARALVQDGAHARIVTIGDPLGGSRVIAIDSSDVRLANGTVLQLAREMP